MSVLCSRKQQEILFCKGAPESIFSRCTSVLCNDDGSAAPMTAEIRAELEERLYRCCAYVAFLRLRCVLSRILIFLKLIDSGWYAVMERRKR